jgi:hypothetical protein
VLRVRLRSGRQNGSQNTVIPTALATGNCELRTECTAASILTDDGGHARGVTYIDSGGRRQEQFADIVMCPAAPPNRRGSS